MTSDPKSVARLVEEMKAGLVGVTFVGFAFLHRHLFGTED